MAAAPFEWLVAGGWAIDLYVERVTRVHKDIEIVIWRGDQMDLREYLEGWDIEIAAGGMLQPWRGEEFVMLPLHELHATHPEASPAHLEILFNDIDDDQWVFRRDQRITRDPATIAERTAHGIPFLAPEIVLLFKARDCTETDQHDFETAMTRMPPTRRLWLDEALAVCEPDHPWRARLSASTHLR